jgi:hypothetical protein
MRAGARTATGCCRVIKVQGRDLALARTAARTATGSPNPAFRRGAHWDHRSYWQAAWLDLSWDAYYMPHDPPEPGQSVALQPYLLSAQCQHECCQFRLTGCATR